MLLLLAALTTQGHETGASADIPYDLQAQLQTMLAWWPGEYSNARQVSRERAMGLADDQRIPGVRLLVGRVTLPAFGEHVFYAEWQDPGDPERITRQRFYGFSIDEASATIRLNLFIFDPANTQRNAQARGAYDLPGKVSDFTLEDMAVLADADCDIYFRREGRQFRGEMRRGACAFEVPGGSGERVYSWTQAIFGPDLYWYSDGWFYPEDDRPYRRFQFGRFVELDRIR